MCICVYGEVLMAKCWKGERYEQENAFPALLNPDNNYQIWPMLICLAKNPAI